LCEALRQKDSPDIDKQLQDQQLDLNESVWSPDSQTFNPPNLSGKVSERTALEAMIIHSDNTGADMILNYIGADNVRRFLTDQGLEHSYIPNSTRQFFGYLAGFPDWQSTTWDEIYAFVNGNRPFVNPPVNPIQTMAASPRDFVSFYARSLQGEFFQNAATLDEYRAILSRADAIQQTIPLGATAFLKGGAIDVNPFHALCLAGGMYLSERWVYFATILNWYYSGDSDLVTAGAFIDAIARAFKLVKRAIRESV
jgi:beta-lactamase class A